jgi:ATP-dependent Lon protease
LNENHYGLNKVKERILEHLAVKVMRLNRKPLILVVDDEEIARRNLEHVLSKEQYEAVTAVDGADALRKLENHEFDVVLTDLKMASLDGMDLLEKIGGRYPDIKVIVVTGFASISSAIEAVKKGGLRLPHQALQARRGPRRRTQGA